MKKITLLFAVCLSAMQVFGAVTLPQGVAVSKSGEITLCGGKKRTIVFTPRWRKVSNGDFRNIKNNITTGGGKFTATFDKNNLKGRYELTITPVDSTTFDVQEKLVFDRETAVPQMASSWSFAVKDLQISIDGKPCKFKNSVTKKDKHVLARKKFKKCEIRALGNTLFTIIAQGKNNTIQV